MENKTKPPKKKCPTSCCLTHEWHLCKSDWLEDIYIVKEIAGKCHKELTGFDRALRNAAFFFFFSFCARWHFGILRLKSQMDFIDLSPCRMFPRTPRSQWWLLLLILPNGLLVTAEGEGERLSAFGWGANGAAGGRLPIKVSLNISKQLMSLYRRTDYLLPGD